MLNKIMRDVYLDNAATTKVDESIASTIDNYNLKEYGNASSMHIRGQNAKWALEKSRRIIGDSINASAEEIFFTSGGTESNNWAIKGIAFANKEKGRHIITTKVEHKCILECCRWLEKQGFEVDYINVDDKGFVDVEELESKIKKETILVSVMHGNNEIGTINDIEKIGEICKKKGVYFHTDACQSYCKTAIDVKKMNISLMSINAHKLHGPKGVGALFVDENVKLDAWQHGGGQEKEMRSGTENISGIVGFAEAVKLALDENNVEKMRALRDKLIRGIMQIPNAKLNGAIGEKRLCNNAHFSFRFIEGESILGMLNELGVCVSTGSACSEKSLEPSYVLKALGLNHEEMNGSVRLSLSRFNTEEEIDYVLTVLPMVVRKLRDFSPFGREEENVQQRSFKEI